MRRTSLESDASVLISLLSSRRRVLSFETSCSALIATGGKGGMPLSAASNSARRGFGDTVVVTKDLSLKTIPAFYPAQTFSAPGTGATPVASLHCCWELFEYR